MAQLPQGSDTNSLIAEIAAGTEPLTPGRRAHFEKWGVEIIRQDLANGGTVFIGGGGRGKEAARLWLKQQDEARAADDRVKWRWHRAGIIASVLNTGVGLAMVFGTLSAGFFAGWIVRSFFQ